MKAIERLIEIGIEIAEDAGMFYEDYEEDAGTPTSTVEVPTPISMTTTRGRGADAG